MNTSTVLFLMHVESTKPENDSKKTQKNKKRRERRKAQLDKLRQLASKADGQEAVMPPATPSDGVNKLQRKRAKRKAQREEEKQQSEAKQRELEANIRFEAAKDTNVVSDHRADLRSVTKDYIFNLHATLIK